ncbi:MAG: twin-arginine translocase TatA/TatE family subunit [Bdellovibrionales bacterium]|nr:twin-arginine translocase TatA/TatE family subunit [Bdellovibrionales bacterium]
MFGLSLTHMILFGIIALIFIGPEQLPEVARTLGRILNELRRATQDFQNQFTGQFRDQTQSFNELRQQLTNLQNMESEQKIAPPTEPAAPETPAPELPVGAHPVSEDEGKKS